MALDEHAESGATLNDDERRLHELGYAQELSRSMSGFSNFAVSFTIISILTGCLTSYTIGLNGGGPVMITWGWLFVGVMTLMVGLSMAEVCSSFPTAGGLYYWSAKLARTSGPAWSWFTGWFNFAGQVAVTASIDFGAALFISPLLGEELNYKVTQRSTFLVFVIILAIHGLLNQFGVNLVKLLNDVSVWWHIAGVAFIVITLAVVPSHHQSASFVFTKFVNGTGFHSGFYAALIGLLLSQYTLTGYDASAHMTEETKNAARTGPRGIVTSILISIIFGWILLLGVTFAIQNYSDVAKNGASEVFTTAVGGTLGKLLIVAAFGAQFFCGMSSVTANSRMIYAFSRDGALPASQVWHRVNKRTRTPTNAIWLAVAGGFVLSVPALWNTVAFNAVVSIAVIALYVSYVIPTFLRLRQGSSFKRGPWHLGRFSTVIGVVAVGWVVIIAILFLLPQSSPITAQTFNYAPVAIAVVLGFAAIWWFASARTWFTGPKVQGSAEELAAIERELREIG